MRTSLDIYVIPDKVMAFVRYWQTGEEIAYCELPYGEMTVIPYICDINTFWCVTCGRHHKIGKKKCGFMGECRCTKIDLRKHGKETTIVINCVEEKNES